MRFLVSFPPGGGKDLMARLVANAASSRLGQSVLVTGDVPITQSHLLGKVPYDLAKDL